MKILLFGKKGQIGWELQRSLSLIGELVTLDFDDEELCGDFTRPKEIIKTINSVYPDIIVNAAAYTAVDKAESEPILAETINATAPKIIATEAQKIGAWLIHYSTDYVFNGNGTKPWKETDPTIPINVYGATKLAGEKSIINSGCKYLIFRTSWVYSTRGENFIKNIIHLAKNKDNLSIINDQIGAPTGAELLADVTAYSICTAIRKPKVSGLYHIAAKGEISWYDYAKFILDQARQFKIKLKAQAENIQPVASRSFFQIAPRPENSRLNTKKIEHIFDFTLPLWQTGVTRILTEIFEKKL
ncbi:MAG: dTDP-4-dehydrorhamnose reductase [Nitrosomonadaceae bacterium]|nr:dTDP-4-dehydrorhamnose reductase [Nitrosomonadaceae bacterium]